MDLPSLSGETRVIPIIGDPIAQVKSRAGVTQTTGRFPTLYARGNDMASVMGGYYPSGGITLGPAMTFGYLAAHDATGMLPGTSVPPALEGRRAVREELTR